MAGIPRHVRRSGAITAGTPYAADLNATSLVHDPEMCMWRSGATNGDKLADGM